jgi:hypothetical protein
VLGAQARNHRQQQSRLHTTARRHRSEEDKKDAAKLDRARCCRHLEKQGDQV